MRACVYVLFVCVHDECVCVTVDTLYVCVACELSYVRDVRDTEEGVYNA